MPCSLATLKPHPPTQVRDIYTAVVDALTASPTRTFAAEIVVFWSAWWSEANATQRAAVRALVASGQLEFAGGGWTQSDEAITRFEDMIDQVTLGHLWVASAMLSPPVTTAWQADPFGHSTGFAYLSSLQALDGFTFGRPMSASWPNGGVPDPLDLQSSTVWHPSSSHPDEGVFDETSILTHDQRIGYWEREWEAPFLLPHSQAPPICRPCSTAFFSLPPRPPRPPNHSPFSLPLRHHACPTKPPSHSRSPYSPTHPLPLFTPTAYRSLHGNLASGHTAAAADQLAGFISTLAAQRPAKQTLVIMAGDDFEGGDAAVIFPALEAVFANLNARPAGILPRLNVSFSTPSRYLRALAAEQAASATTDRPLAFDSRPAWDALPLIGCEFPSPWVGYYVSRPDFKLLFHAASSFRRAITQLHALARDAAHWRDDFAALLPLWQAVSLVQHHDAITADSYDNVMEDYRGYVDAGIGAAGGVAASAATTLGVTGVVPCFNASAAPCAPIVAGLSSEGSSVTLTVYNPLSWFRDEFVTVLVPSAGVVVTEATAGGVTIAAQATAADDTDSAGTLTALTFLAAALPPLGFRVYTLTAVSPGAAGAAVFSPATPLAGPTTITNGAALSLTFAGNGSLVAVANADEGVSLPVRADMLYYSSAVGKENGWDMSTEGKDWSAAAAFPGAGATATVTRGNLFEEVRVVVDANAGVSLRARLYHGEGHAQLTVGVGPFPVGDARSKDALLRITTPLASAGAWGTDVNGLENRERARNLRPWWPTPAVDAADPVSSNVYPVTAAASLSDAASGVTLALLPALVSHGATSPADGVLDVILARAVLASGPFPALANRHVTVTDALTVHASRASSASARRPLQSRLANPVLVLASSGGASLPSAPFAPLAAPLPPSLEIASLQLFPAGLDVSAAAQGPPPTGAGRPAAADPPPPSAPPPLSSAVLLLRVRHVYAVGEDDARAQPVDLDLAALFAPRWTVLAARETTLTATRDMDAARAQQIQWAQVGQQAGSAVRRPNVTAAALHGASGFVFTLRPMDIKTFLLTVE